MVADRVWLRHNGIIAEIGADLAAEFVSTTSQCRVGEHRAVAEGLTTVEPALQRAAIFDRVEHGVARTLARRLHRVGFRGGQTVFSEVEPGDHLYLIISGSVRISRRRASGGEHLMAILGASDVFGELCLFDPGPREATATAITDVRARTLDRAALRAWIAQRPEIITPLLAMLTEGLRRSESDLCDLLHTDDRCRLAKQLLSLAHHCGTRRRDGIEVPIALSDEDLAQLAATTNSRVSRVLADFCRRGWIQMDGQHMLITDAESLAATGMDRQAGMK